jgi:hypothetical protein
MNMDKDVIRRVLKAQTKIEEDIVIDGNEPSDFSIKEWIDMIYNELVITDK